MQVSADTEKNELHSSKVVVNAAVVFDVVYALKDKLTVLAVNFVLEALLVVVLSDALQIGQTL